MLLTSNPFQLPASRSPDGRDLNPLLRIRRWSRTADALHGYVANVLRIRGFAFSADWRTVGPTWAAGSTAVDHSWVMF